jgi:hypothetical protein
MNPSDSRSLFIGSVAVIVLTQIACTVWIGRQLEVVRPVDNSSELAGITEQLASVENSVSGVQDTANTVQARTQALIDSMGSVARACSR